MDTARIAPHTSLLRDGFGRFPVRILFLGVIAMNAIAADTVNFDSASPGALPEGWSPGVTGRGSPRWSVERDPSAPSAPNVLEQSGSGTLPWCVLKSAAIENGFVEVKLKPVSGKEDQAGGAVGVWTKADSVTLFDDFTYGSTAAK